MADILLTEHAQGVIDNIVQTMTFATVEGKRVFYTVGVFDDLATFQRVADPLKGVVCGVITGQPEQGEVNDNAEAYVERLQVTIACRFSTKRGAGQPDANAVREAQRLVEILRITLLADRTRGGRASVVTFNGRMLDGTEVRASPRIQAGKAGESFGTLTLLVSIGWSG